MQHIYSRVKVYEQPRTNRNKPYPMFLSRNTSWKFANKILENRCWETGKNGRQMKFEKRATRDLSEGKLLLAKPNIMLIL